MESQYIGDVLNQNLSDAIGEILTAYQDNRIDLDDLRDAYLWLKSGLETIDLIRPTLFDY